MKVPINVGLNDVTGSFSAKGTEARKATNVETLKTANTGAFFKALLLTTSRAPLNPAAMNESNIPNIDQVYKKESKTYYELS